MDRIDLLRIFVRVVDCASFTRAADTLALPRSSVSTAVRLLEARVGARLLHRTTRRVAPTLDGHAFHERCQRLLAEYEETEALFRQPAQRPRGRLRVNMPSRFGRLVVAPALPDFLAHYPDIEIELGSTDRAVDLVAEGVDCAIRVGTLGDSALVARRLGELAMVNCASPSYLAVHGVPRNIAELACHRVIHYAPPATGRVGAWTCEGDEGRHSLRLAGAVTVNDAEAYIACALAGLGLIQVPAYDVQPHLAAGALVAVLPRMTAPPMPLTLLYPHRQHLSHRLKAFLDWIEPLLRARVLDGADLRGEIGA